MATAINLAEMPAEFQPSYSPAIDRVDVAIRAAMRLFQQRRWELLGELGLTKAQHEPALTVAYFYVEDLRAETQIAALLELCPFLFGAALELLRRYSVLTAASKREWWKDQNKETQTSGNVSHHSGRRRAGH